jgi:nucleoside-diphosphate-sugar epimerase
MVGWGYDPTFSIVILNSRQSLSAVIAGKQEIATRLCGNLQVDISKTGEFLGWKPPITVDQGLERAVKGFLCETI